MINDGQAAPVIAGLSVGIAFVIAFSWISLNRPLAPSSSQQDDWDSAAGTTRNLNEVKEFMTNYPTTNTTVYFITTCSDEPCSTLSRVPSIVEYSYRETSGEKYSDLRIEISQKDGKAIFFQIRCLTEGSENSIEVHGPRLEGITEFLKHDQCPK